MAHTTCVAAEPHAYFDPAATVYRYMRDHPDEFLPFTPAETVAEYNAYAPAYAHTHMPTCGTLTWCGGRFRRLHARASRALRPAE